VYRMHTYVSLALAATQHRLTKQWEYSNTEPKPTLQAMLPMALNAFPEVFAKRNQNKPPSAMAPTRATQGTPTWWGCVGAAVPCLALQLCCWFPQV
jgi:hypothetical protein